MSEVALTPAELDDYIRPKIDRILVTHNHNTGKTLHVMSDERWMEPACSTVTTSGNWTDKSIALYPRGFRPFCKECAEQHFDIEVIDDEC